MTVKQTKGSTFRGPMQHDSCFGKGYAAGGYVGEEPDARLTAAAAIKPVVEGRRDQRRNQTDTPEVSTPTFNERFRGVDGDDDRIGPPSMPHSRRGA